MLFLALGGLLVFMALLRFRGNDYLLPLLVEPDPHIAVQVRLLEEHAPEPELDVNYGAYPHLTAWTTIAMTDPAEVPPPTIDGRPPGLEDHLRAASDPVLRVRWAVGWLSLLALPGAWFLARRFLSPGWSLVATAFTAFSLLAAHFGAQARPHGAAMGFSTLAVVACLRLGRTGRVRDLALASLLAALCFATLQSGIALAFPILVAFLVAERRHSGSYWTSGWRSAQLALPLIALCLVLGLFYPFLFAHSQGGDAAELSVAAGTLKQSGHKVFLGLFNGRGFPVLASSLWSWEPMLAVASVSALLVLLGTFRGRTPEGLRVDRGDLLVVFAYVLPYLLVNGMYARVYERFLLPMIPFLGTFAAWGLARLAVTPCAKAIPVVTALLLLPSAWVGWQLTELRRAPNTLELAGAWLEEHADPASDRVLITRPVRLPFFETLLSEAEEGGDPSHDPRLTWTEYQSQVLPDARPAPAWNAVWMPLSNRPGLNRLKFMAQNPERYVQQRFGAYLVAEVFAEGRISRGLEAVHEVFRAQGELLARFSPDGQLSISEHPLKYQDETGVSVPHFAWRVLRAECMGPVLEILRPPHLQPRGRQQ